jgi:hypothetical protein
MSGLVMMETAVLACTDETARTEPDEADKTVMGASCTGSYEVTDVEPGDVQGRGHPGPIDESRQRQPSVGQAESQTSRGDSVLHILTNPKIHGASGQAAGLRVTV